MCDVLFISAILTFSCVLKSVLQTLAVTFVWHPASGGGNDEQQPEFSPFSCHLLARNGYIDIILSWCHLFCPLA